MVGGNTLGEEMDLSRQYAESRDDASGHERDLTIPKFATVLGLIGVVGAYNGLVYVADKAVDVASGLLSNIQGGTLNRG